MKQLHLFIQICHMYSISLRSVICLARGFTDLIIYGINLVFVHLNRDEIELDLS
jgi:uncharacterized protein with PQ loop repeat